ncbi:MAG: penicillin-binding protein 2 [Hyphomicrobium sp.]
MKVSDMRAGVRSAPVPAVGGKQQRWPRAAIANATLAAAVLAAFSAVGAQLVVLGVRGGAVEATLALTEAAATNFARPDIIDRNGRLLATDVEAPSLFADPAIVLDRDELVEKLSTVLPDLDQGELRAALSDRTRRFVWIRRGLAPKTAQKIHDLGLPGLAFRKELRRAYPAGLLAGHVLGTVNIDNKGVAGIEKYIDDVVGVEGVHGAELSDHAPVRLSIDVGVQHSLEDELDTAMRRYGTEGAAGLVLDIRTGEVMASASFPRIDPSRAQMSLDPAKVDRIAGGTYELGSVFKTITVAMALDEGLVTSATMLDVREPLAAGRFTITDLHPAGRPLSVEEVFTHSSNVGAGMLALQAGPERFKGFLQRAGLLDPMQTELGPVSAPQVPDRFERIQLITMSYGHGIAVAPLQFAAAAASVLNGGNRVTPTFVRYRSDTAKPPSVTTDLTSREMARLFRLNVMDASGTGKRADVPGYRVGGKTGTAERADNGRYREKAVISSFLGAFPMDSLQYLTFIALFEPKASVETGGQRTASSNAAPVTGRLIRRIAPQLAVAPLNIEQTQ